MMVTRGSAAAMPSITSMLPSVLPSSTRMSSHGCLRSCSACATSRCSMGRFSTSFLMGTMTERATGPSSRPCSHGSILKGEMSKLREAKARCRASSPGSGEPGGMSCSMRASTVSRSWASASCPASCRRRRISVASAFSPSPARATPRLRNASGWPGGAERMRRLMSRAVWYSPHMMAAPAHSRPMASDCGASSAAMRSRRRPRTVASCPSRKRP